MNSSNIKLLSESKKIFNWHQINKEKINLIKKYASGEILDVGCASGSYVRYLNKSGYDTFGCDILSDKLWNTEYKNKYKKASVFRLLYKKNAFETIISFEVLEHVEDPERALREISRVAAKCVILSVPNCELDPIFSYSGFTYFHYMDRSHVNFFRIDTIINLLEKNKFKVKEIKYLDPVKPVTFFLYSINIPILASRIIGEIFRKLPLTRKYYTDITIVAYKN